MEAEAKVRAPRMKYRSFHYHTHLHWEGDRSGILKAADRPDVRVSSPIEFKGEAGVWTPEDLFVATAEICTMTTFMAFAHREGLRLVSYKSEAEGLLEHSDGDYRFTKITVKPVVIVKDAKDLERASALMERAHRDCLIAHSMTTEIDVEPSITHEAP